MSMQGFKKELLEKHRAQLDMLCRNIGGITADRAADMLITSVARLKQGDQVEDTPLYKAASVLNTLRVNNFLGVNTRKALLKKMEELGKIPSGQAANVLNYYDWRLPNHLKPRRYTFGRTVKDMPTLNPEPKQVSPVVNLADGDRISEITIKGAGIEIAIKITKT